MQSFSARGLEHDLIVHDGGHLQMHALDEGVQLCLSLVGQRAPLCQCLLLVQPLGRSEVVVADDPPQTALFTFKAGRHRQLLFLNVLHRRSSMRTSLFLAIRSSKRLMVSSLR